LLVCIAVILGQMKALQDQPVVHLPPHRSAIQIDFGGKLLELPRLCFFRKHSTNPPI